ncbi:MAG: hypothetical protein ACI915_000570 [Gammaproteobacteria bacterium]|jgi:hypothetical protein
MIRLHPRDRPLVEKDTRDRPERILLYQLVEEYCSARKLYGGWFNA